MSVIVLLGIARRAVSSSRSSRRGFRRRARCGAHRAARADHVSLHPARLARRAGDGHAQCEATSSACRRWRRVSSISARSSAAWRSAGGSIRRSDRRALIGLALGTLHRRRAATRGADCRRCGASAIASGRTSTGAMTGVRTILRLMGPAIIAASSVQVNVMINTWFAS